MMNFASLVDLYEDAEDKIEALEHAAAGIFHSLRDADEFGLGGA